MVLWPALRYRSRGGGIRFTHAALTAPIVAIVPHDVLQPECTSPSGQKQAVNDVLSLPLLPVECPAWWCHQFSVGGQK
eukprot:scaffold3664_cov407-Prasinococcus_capsulatus_cf.AAC.9